MSTSVQAIKNRQAQEREQAKREYELQQAISSPVKEPIKQAFTLTSGERISIVRYQDAKLKEASESYQRYKRPGESEREASIAIDGHTTPGSYMVTMYYQGDTFTWCFNELDKALQWSSDQQQQGASLVSISMVLITGFYSE